MDFNLALKQAPNVEITPQARLDFGTIHHVSALHSKHKSGVVFTQITADGKWCEHGARQYNEAVDYARIIGKEKRPDTYMGVNGVIPFNRRSYLNINQLTCNFVDADCYTVGMGQEQAFSTALSICEQSDLPNPTQIFDSGRGLYLFWIYPKPVYVGTKSDKSTGIKAGWGYSQESLIKLFSSIGADPRCKDLARVLRLAGTLNSKNGQRVTAYDVGQRITPQALSGAIRKAITPDQQEPITPTPRPVSTVRQRKVARTTSAGSKVRSLLNPRTLVYSRMQDLSKLAELRGGKLEDHRAMAIFYFAVSSSVYCNTRESLLREVSIFMFDCIAPSPRYDYRNPEKLLTTVLRRHEQTRQARLDGNGGTVDLNYKPRNATIIKELKITEAEQQEMLVLIGVDEKRRRDALKKRITRKAKGVKPRAEYQAEAERKRQLALNLRAEGLSIRAIADEVKVSKSQAQRYIEKV